MEASFRRTQRCFREVRNSYIRYIVPDVLDRQTRWENAMRKAGITRFVPEQREAAKMDYWKISTRIHSPDDAPLIPAFGVTYTWQYRKVGVKRMKCFQLRLFWKAALV